mgnify:CR=1 FL=1
MRDVYVNGLGNVLAALPPCDRFLYVSSTSVYGQADGSVVDETSPTEPLGDSGRTVLEAERLLQALLPSAIGLRFAGIYGPGRLLRRQAVLRSAIASRWRKSSSVVISISIPSACSMTIGVCGVVVTDAGLSGCCLLTRDEGGS